MYIKNGEHDYGHVEEEYLTQDSEDYEPQVWQLLLTELDGSMHRDVSVGVAVMMIGNKRKYPVGYKSEVELEGSVLLVTIYDSLLNIRVTTSEHRVLPNVLILPVGFA